MADGAEYDDDFEEISEEEGAKVGGDGYREPPLQRQPIYGVSASANSPASGKPHRPGRRALQNAAPAASPPISRGNSSQLISGGPGLRELGLADAVPLASCSGPPSGNRVVRGRVTALGEDDGKRRPGSHDSNHSSGNIQLAGNSGGFAGAGTASAGAASSKPLWLQFDSKKDANHTPERQVDWLRHDLGTPIDRGNRPPRGEVGSRSGERPPRGDSGDTFGAADGDDRKAKRLQQDVQRLTQRLKEAELFSSQDDGIPAFSLDEVQLGAQIAQGGFACVHHARWRYTPCAIKKIFDPVITDELKADFDNEVRMLRRLRHPGIVTLMAVCRIAPALAFITEYVEGGSLFEALHDRSRSPMCGDEGTLPHILHQAASALAYMHVTDVVHRDVKSHNVLLSRTDIVRPHAKLCDFGLARMRSELCTGTMQWAGTAAYMAPELFEKKKYTEAVDIFAFGVMLWESAAGDIPHANFDAPEIFQRITTKAYAGLSVSGTWLAAFRELLTATLAVAPADRRAMADVADALHDFQGFPGAT